MSSPPSSTSEPRTDAEGGATARTARSRPAHGDLPGLAVLGGVLGVVLAGRALLAPPGWLVPLVGALPWLTGTAACACGLLTLSRPARRGGLAGLLGLGLLSTVLWGPSLQGPPPDSGVSLRVLTWNVQGLHRYGALRNYDETTRCVAEVILAADPDVLALVETSGHNSERLETALGLDCAQVDYLQTGKAGPYGVAVCTRGEDWVLKNARARRFESERDWAYMFSEIQHTSPGRSDQIFNLLAVHLRAFPHPENPLADLAQLDATSEQVARDQSEQAHELLQRVKQFRDPTLVAGDFNNTRDAALHVELRRSLLDTWETAGQGPGGTRPIGHLLDLELPEWARIVPRVDYIYATPTFWAEQAWVPEVDCTDHRPVVADLVLETPR